MKIVAIESPLAAPTPEERARNIRYAAAAVRDSLERGELPIAPHLLYARPGILDDENPAERARGLALCSAWRSAADLVAVYIDLGISAGMAEALEEIGARGHHYERRGIEGWEAGIPTDPGSILLEADSLINGARQEAYSHPLDDYSRTAAMWTAIIGAPVTPEQAILCMVAVKLSRECHRSARDNRVDAAGYLGCLDLLLQERERRGQ